jgi:hypothetical protein
MNFVMALPGGAIITAFVMLAINYGSVVTVSGIIG